MNKSDIEWTQFSNNPIRGKCPHFGTDICGTYCYADRIREKQLQWTPKELRDQAEKMKFYPDVLQQIARRGKPSVIFMGSMIDLWAAAVPAEWIEKILFQCRLSRQHTFLFLTKNPKRYFEFEFPENCWVGVTDDCRESDTYPLDDFGEWITTTRKFISFEPLLGPLRTSIPTDVEQIIVGAMTGPGALKPEKKWIMDILDASKGKSVFLKNNLLSLFPELPWRQETAWVV